MIAQFTDARIPSSPNDAHARSLAGKKSFSIQNTFQSLQMSHKWETLNVVLFLLKRKARRANRNAWNIFKPFFRERFHAYEIELKYERRLVGVVVFRLLL